MKEIKFHEINEKKFICLGQALDAYRPIVSQAIQYSLSAGQFLPNDYGVISKTFRAAQSNKEKIGFDMPKYVFIEVETNKVGSSQSSNCTGSINTVDERVFVKGKQTEFFTSEYVETFNAGPASAGTRYKTFYNIEFVYDSLYLGHQFPEKVEDMIKI